VKTLEQAGVVRRAVVGRTHRLELEPGSLTEAADWLDSHRVLWTAKLDAIERHLAGESP
jgi:hypothetical protein